MREGLRDLEKQLREAFDELARRDSSSDAAMRRRALGTEVLTVVRAAAGRVIDRDFGEGIPGDVSALADDLEGRFFDLCA